MTAEKHETLAAALAAFQAELPVVHKGATGQVPGKRTHKYADLADLSAAVLPLLGKHGLSWITMPTVEDGAFTLRYELLHVSKESRVGFYPLPTGTAWEIGSALTYGRRYCLSAVTGVAADEDDDGAAAQDARPDYNQQRRAPQRPAQPLDAPPQPVAKEALEELAVVCTAMGYDRGMVAKLYADTHKGADIRQATDPAQVRAFIDRLDNVDPTRLKAPAVPASNGAAT